MSTPAFLLALLELDVLARQMAPETYEKYLDTRHSVNRHNIVNAIGRAQKVVDGISGDERRRNFALNPSAE